jgi:DNA-binding response OmpR family regulator
MARILLIDDDDAVRASVESTLRRAGHSVKPARNGREALAFFGNDSFDLIVTDLVMPEMEGIETIREFRKAGNSTPILAMSGGGQYSTTTPYLDAAQKLGADAALHKPFSADQLRATVDRLTASLPGH